MISNLRKIVSSFLGTREKIPLSQVSSDIFQATFYYVEGFIKDCPPASPFKTVNKQRLFEELMILAFWNLKFMQCKESILESTLKVYVETYHQNEAEQENRRKIIQNRFKLYSDSWENDENKMFIFFTIVAGNIDESFKLNMLANMGLAVFFTNLSEAYAKILKHINNVEIILQ